MDLQRRHRGTWIFSLTASVIILVLSVAYAFAPALACRFAELHMPMHLGKHYQLTHASVHPQPGASPVTLSMNTQRARLFANSIHHVWMPPGMIRLGETASGTGQLPKGDQHFEWRVAICDQGPRPTLAIRMTSAELNELLAPYRHFVMHEEGMTFDYVIDSATVVDDDAPDQSPSQRRLRVDAKGTMSFAWRRWHVHIPIEHLLGHALWTFTPVAGGIRPGCTITIDKVEGKLPNIPFVNWDRVWPKLETSMDKAFAKHLPKHIWPSASPVEAVVDVVISNGTDAGSMAVIHDQPRRQQPLAQL